MFCSFEEFSFFFENLGVCISKGTLGKELTMNHLHLSLIKALRQYVWRETTSSRGRYVDISP